MSRESDLALLDAMKEEINQIYFLSDQCRGNMAKCEALKNEKENPTPPTIKKLPTNAEKRLRGEYTGEWEDRCARTKWIKVICVLVNALVVAAITAAMILDMFAKTGLIIPASAIAAIADKDIFSYTVVAQAVLALVMILAPILIIRGEDD